MASYITSNATDNDASNIEHYSVVYNAFPLTRVVDPSETKASLQHMLLYKWLFPLKNRPWQTLLCRYSSSKILSKTSLEWTSQPHRHVTLRRYYLTHTRLLIPKPEFPWLILYSLGSVDFFDEQNHVSLPLWNFLYPRNLIGLYAVCNSCVHAHGLWEAVQVMYWCEWKMFFFSKCLQNEEFVLSHMRE